MKYTWTLKLTPRDLLAEDGHHNIPTMDLFEWVSKGICEVPAIDAPFGDPFERAEVALSAHHALLEFEKDYPLGMRGTPQIWWAYTPNPRENFGRMVYYILFKFENNGNSYVFELEEVSVTE